MVYPFMRKFLEDSLSARAKRQLKERRWRSVLILFLETMLDTVQDIVKKDMHTASLRKVVEETNWRGK